jgi:type IV secretion system protein VirB6
VLRGMARAFAGAGRGSRPGGSIRDLGDPGSGGPSSGASIPAYQRAARDHLGQADE